MQVRDLRQFVINYDAVKYEILTLFTGYPALTENGYKILSAITS